MHGHADTNMEEMNMNLKREAVSKSIPAQLFILYKDHTPLHYGSAIVHYIELCYLKTAAVGMYKYKHKYMTQ